MPSRCTTPVRVGRTRRWPRAWCQPRDAPHVGAGCRGGRAARGGGGHRDGEGEPAAAGAGEGTRARAEDPAEGREVFCGGDQLVSSRFQFVDARPAGPGSLAYPRGSDVHAGDAVLNDVVGAGHPVPVASPGGSRLSCVASAASTKARTSAVTSDAVTFFVHRLA